MGLLVIKMLTLPPKSTTRKHQVRPPSKISASLRSLSRIHSLPLIFSQTHETFPKSASANLWVLESFIFWFVNACFLRSITSPVVSMSIPLPCRCLYSLMVLYLFLVFERCIFDVRVFSICHMCILLICFVSFGELYFCDLSMFVFSGLFRHLQSLCQSLCFVNARILWWFCICF